MDTDVVVDVQGVVRTSFCVDRILFVSAETTAGAEG